MCKYWNSFFSYHDDETSEEFIFHFSSRQPAYYYAKNGKFIQTEEDDDEKNKQSYDCNETSSSAYSTHINKALDVLYTFLSELPNIKRGKNRNWIWQASTVIHLMWQYLHQNENQ